MRPASKWLFVLGLPSGSPEIAKVGTPVTLGPHNFVCKPPIEMRSIALVESFPMVCHMPFARKEIGSILDF